MRRAASSDSAASWCIWLRGRHVWPASSWAPWQSTTCQRWEETAAVQPDVIDFMHVWAATGACVAFSQDYHKNNTDQKAPSHHRLCTSSFSFLADVLRFLFFCFFKSLLLIYKPTMHERHRKWCRLRYWRKSMFHTVLPNLLLAWPSLEKWFHPTWW